MVNYMQVFWFLTKWACFLMFYYVSNCFKRKYLSSCQYWVGCLHVSAAVWNNKCPRRGQQKSYNPWVSYLIMNFQNPFLRRKIPSKAFNSYMVCYIVINNFFVSFETSGGSYNLSQNTLRLISEFEKCIPSFMESLIASFVQFSSAIAKFLFLQKGD